MDRRDEHQNHTSSQAKREWAQPPSGDFNEELQAIALNDPAFSIVCDPSLDRVVRRGQQLEASLESMRTSFPKRVEELLQHYHKLTVKIEMDKITAVMNSTRDKYKRLNDHYNNQRYRLLSAMEEEIDRLKNQKAVRELCLKEQTNYKDGYQKAQQKPPELCTGNASTLDKDVNWKALKIMQEWYRKNEDNPYPSRKDVHDISKKGNISVSDIYMWFQFERIRRSGLRS